MKLELSNLLKCDSAKYIEARHKYEENNYLISNQKYSEILEEYPDDPDVLHNLGCCYFMQNNTTEALECFKKSTAIMWSYHSTYHFIASAVYYNIGIEMQEKGETEKSKQAFIKSEFLYHENLDAQNAIHGIYNNNKQNMEANMFKHGKTAGNILIFRNQENKISQSDDNYIEQLDKEHFLYHCMAARNFFHRGICFIKNNRPDIGKNDIIRAMEFDQKNPDNSKMESVITAIVSYHYSC